ncbi:hypothetical protein [Geodermatophilus sp. CPCC 205506]|uniref:hypothetical protein n=1 Tax=Geodermatophilus sp. CPCC 205506 TaxID=2936596 RepID=UPI003EEEC935
MKTREFTYSVRGNAATFDDVLPDFDRNERLGIVSRTAGSSLRAAGLLLAAVGRFYEIRLAESEDFYAYPNFFVFHVGDLHGYHGMIDVWPEHKEVIVGKGPESIVSAVNDRGITRLLIEEAPRARGLMARETVEGLRESLKTAYTFDPFGAGLDGADVVVTPSSTAVGSIAESARASSSILGSELAEHLASRAAEPQFFRPLGVEEVFSVLSGYGESDPDLTFSSDYQRAHALTESDMDRHRYAVGTSVRPGDAAD